jgi:glycosyltransferase involved in cell wall biosynthesis
MKLKSFYIDSVDIDVLYGSGAAPLLKSAVKEQSNIFYFIGSSSGYKKNKWHKLNLYGNSIDYFSLKSRANNKLPRNILLAISVFFQWKKIKKIDASCKIIFLRSYTLLWLFTFFIRQYKVIYYAPGLGNPLVMGRFTFLSIIHELFNLIHFKALTRASSLLAAASKTEIEVFNKKLKKNNSKVLFIQVPESVDTDHYKPQDKFLAMESLSNNFSLPESDLIFSYIGRIAKVKGLPLIIDAFKEFRKNNPKSTLLIAGTGELNLKIKQYIKYNELEKYVLMLGNLNPDKIVSLINISNACLFASYFEGFSFAMLEILSCGKPIVSTEVSGTDELILKNKTGVVVNTRDPKIYSKAMQEVINIKDSDKYCRDLVLNNYTNEKQWKTIITNIDVSRHQRTF